MNYLVGQAHCSYQVNADQTRLLLGDKSLQSKLELDQAQASTGFGFRAWVRLGPLKFRLPGSELSKPTA